MALRIAMMAETRPEVVAQVESVMRSRLSAVGAQEYAAAGGVKSLADILNHSDRSTERNVLDELAKADGELAEEIRLLLFTFEDVVKLDDRSIQMVLKEVDQKDLAIALRGVSEDVRGAHLLEHVRARRRAAARGDRLPAAAAQARGRGGAGPHRRRRAPPRGGRRDRHLARLPAARTRWSRRWPPSSSTSRRSSRRLRRVLAERRGRRRHGDARRRRARTPSSCARPRAPRASPPAMPRRWPRWSRRSPRWPQAVAGRARRSRSRPPSELERQAVELGLALAEKVLAGALAVEPERVRRGRARRAARARRARAGHRARQPGRSRARARGDGRAARRRSAASSTASSRPSAASRRGGCVVRTPEGDVDARVETKLERAREVVAAALGRS